MEHEYGLIGGNIFHGELSPDQLFHMRPGARLRRLHDADRRAVPVLVGHARRRRRDRHPGVAVHPADPRRPPPGPAAAALADRARPPWVSRSIRAADPPGRARRRARPDDGSGCMLPAARVHATNASLAWERSNLFAGALGVRGTVGRARDAGSARRGRRRRRRGRARARRRRGAARVLQRLPAPRPRADAVRRDRRPARRSTARTTAGSTGSTARCCDTALRGARRLRLADAHGLTPVAVEEWHGWVMVNVTGSAPPLRRFVDGLEDRIAPYEPRATRRRRHPRLRARRQLEAGVENYHECYHCPRIHPELCGVSPPTSGENYDGHDGLWIGGWHGPATARRDDVAHRRQRRGDAAAASTSSPRRRVVYIGLLPEPADQPAPRLRDDPPARAAAPPTAPRSSASGCSIPAPPVGTTSTRRTRSTSGTSPTARTGPRARACSAGSRRAATGPGPFSERGRGQRLVSLDRPRLPRRPLPIPVSAPRDAGCRRGSLSPMPSRLAIAD